VHLIGFALEIDTGLFSFGLRHYLIRSIRDDVSDEPANSSGYVQVERSSEMAVFIYQTTNFKR
jgi:hypothetical protein